MPDYELNPKMQETWTRGQIFRTAIIFIEIVVLLTAVLLNSLAGADVPTADTAPHPQVVEPVARDGIPTTIYVTRAFRVFVVQNSVHRLVGTLAECSNRYLDTDFDGVLIDDSFALYRRDIIHMATFFSDAYEITARSTEVTLHLDDGRTYTVALHCNGEFGMDAYNSQQVHVSTGLEDLVSAAQRHNNVATEVEPVRETRYSEDSSDYGCQGEHH